MRFHALGDKRFLPFKVANAAVVSLSGTQPGWESAYLEIAGIGCVDCPHRLARLATVLLIGKTRCRAASLPSAHR